MTGAVSHKGQTLEIADCRYVIIDDWNENFMIDYLILFLLALCLAVSGLVLLQTTRQREL